MESKDFCYWLQGFAEIGYESPTPEQWNVIKDHLALVFTKVTPDYSNIGKINYPAGVRDFGKPYDVEFPNFPNQTIC